MNETEIEILNYFINKLTNNQIDIEPEFAEDFSFNFWDLLQD